MIDAAQALSHEPSVRAAAFLAALAALALAERRWPRRGDARWAWRQFHNFALTALGTLLVRLCFPVLAVGAAFWVEAHHIGLLHLLAAPPWLAFGVALAALDLIIYFQHRLFHRVPWLWRLHRVHHSDLAFDTSLALRFHPLELGLSMLIKIGAVLLLGAPPLAVLVFELLLSVGALFTHADLALPESVDRVLRRLLVTPDMHRVHHSPERDETDSNFGFHLAVWDRLFGTYRAQPRSGHQAMTIGLEHYRSASEQRLWALLRQPFTRPRP
jgi:sterol desaturase/sphingolipid hydroxylase (fatty acid hydroxylase superfamily)